MMVLVFTTPDDHGDLIAWWYSDGHNLPPEKAAQGTEIDSSLLSPPEVERWQQALPYLVDGPDVEWRVVDRPDDDPSHLHRELAEIKPAVLGVEPWVAPTGAHDAPNIGDHRLHDGKVWRSTIDGNTVEPGTHPDFDWWVETEPPTVPDVLRQPLAALRPQVEDAQDVVELRDVMLELLDVLTGG